MKSLVSMANASWVLCLSLCLLLFCHGSVAQTGQVEQRQQQQRPFGDRRQCRFENLRAVEPSQRVESEAGSTEYWDQNDEQFACAGVAATRHIIEPRGLLLPEFANAPRLVYIEQGRGITGVVIPGCPETFHSFQQSQQYGRGELPRNTDQHQQIRRFSKGDIIALPAGVAHWCYNDGEDPVVSVTVFDTGSHQNQLDQNLRKFHLAGNERQQSTYSYRPFKSPPSNNVFSGFDVETLAESFGVSTETARKLQNQDDQRGNIVRVENGLQLISPPRREEEEDQQQRGLNGLEETLCTMRLRENIADPRRADVYTPQGGRVTSINSQTFPILSYLQMNAERGVLYKNALYTPRYSMNAHLVVYATGGRGRIQIVGHNGHTVFDKVVQRGEMVLVPQMFAVVKQASDEGFEYIAFKTNDNAITNHIAGKASAIRAMPESVIMNSYRMSREEARRIKNNRGEEMVVFSPLSTRPERRTTG